MPARHQRREPREARAAERSGTGPEPKASSPSEALLALSPALRKLATSSSLDEYARQFDPDCGLWPLFPPPMVTPPRRSGLPASWSTPFLTSIVGSLPHGPPDDVDELLQLYVCSGASR